MRRFFVYMFVDHNTGNPVYVGKGSCRREIQHHFSASSGQDSRFYRWMRKYKRVNNCWPKLFKLAEGLNEREAFDLEKALIVFHGRADRKTGCLFNHTDGGDGVSGYSHSREEINRIIIRQTGKKLSPESIAKRTASVLGRKCSPETILKMRMAAQAREPMSPETRAKISLAGKGRKASVETLAKLSKARQKRPSGNKGHKGYTISAEGRARMSIAAKLKGADPSFRAKISVANKGKPSWRKGMVTPPEVRAKISASNKGRIASVESRAKMSATRKGRTLSDEHKLNVSLGLKRMYERERLKLVA